MAMESETCPYCPTRKGLAKTGGTGMPAPPQRLTSPDPVADWEAYPPVGKLAASPWVVLYATVAGSSRWCGRCTCGL